MKKAIIPRSLYPSETAYLRNAIESTDLRRAQKALQYLCKLARQGLVVSRLERDRLELVILGVLSLGSSDEPLRRWALNALAVVGKPQSSLQSILNAIQQFHDEPQVVSAAIVAAHKMSAGANSLISRLDTIEPKLVMLSAMQASGKPLRTQSKLTIDIDHDGEILRRLSLVNIGLGKAPENLFDPRYPNREIVSVLSREGEPMVSQYAVWAIAENELLSVADLGIPFNRIDDQPINVQAYIHRMYGEKGAQDAQQHEILSVGLESSHRKIRLETAIGIASRYHDGLDTIVGPSVLNESDEDVFQQLLDHVVRHADRSSIYRNIALQQYEIAQGDDILRLRMRAAGVGKEILNDFREFDEEMQLGFLKAIRVEKVVNNTWNNNGPVQGNIAQGGNAVNTGTVNSQTVANSADAVKWLKTAEIGIQDVPLADETKQQLLDVIRAAQASPTKENIGVAHTLLEKAKDMLDKLGDASDSVVKIAGLASLLAPFLG